MTGENSAQKQDEAEQSGQGDWASVAQHTTSDCFTLYLMQAIALYDYVGQDTTLSFQKGDMIQVIQKMENGWWDGLLNGQRGWFPSNYVALDDDSDLNASTVRNPSTNVVFIHLDSITVGHSEIRAR